MTVKTDFQDLDGNPFAKIILTHVENGKRRSFESWVKDDFSINSVSDYVSPFEDLFEGQVATLEAYKGVGQVGSNAFGQLAGDNPIVKKALEYLNKAVNSATLKNASFTISRWSSTQKIIFPVNMTFITLNRNSNIMNEAIDLTGRVHPRVTVDGFLAPPGGYKLLHDGVEVEETSFDEDGNVLNQFRQQLDYKKFSADGSWSINIGGWFHATNLILVDASMTVSKEMTPYGPLSIEVDCQLEPFRQITEEEYRNYFRQSVFRGSGAGPQDQQRSYNIPLD